jgi:hypothetical protein
MKLLAEIKTAWGWTGIDPVRIIDGVQVQFKIMGE